MLNDKLRLFNELVQPAIALHGLNPAAVADAVIDRAFPETSAAAVHEGCDRMLRDGCINYLKGQFKNAPAHDPSQVSFDFPENLKPIISKLKGEAHYVEALEQFMPIGLLIANPQWLDDARKYKRRKGEETLAEAAVLDELYHAVIGA